MKIFLIVYLFFSILYLNAQVFESQSTVGTVVSMDDIFTKHLNKAAKEEILGSPFLFPSWKNAGYIYAEGNLHTLKNLNYNILSDEIGTLVGKDSVLVFNKAIIDSFSVKKVMFKKYNELFYQVMYDGSKITLLKKYEINIVEGMFNPIDGTKKKSRFKTIDDYYIKNSNNIVKFTPSKRSILSIFKEDEIRVKKFIKQNKLSFKKEIDLIKIFEYYNQL